MKFIKYFVLTGILFISTVNVFPQTTAKPALKIKVDRVSVLYRELITDEKGATNKNQHDLYALNKFVKDSVIVWAKKFNVNDADGFEKFASYTGRRLDIKPGKKITIDFIDLKGKVESYNIWSMANNKYRIEEVIKAKR